MASSAYSATPAAASITVRSLIPAFSASKVTAFPASRLARNTSTRCRCAIRSTSAGTSFIGISASQSLEDPFLNAAAVLHFRGVEVALRVGCHVVKHVELAGGHARAPERVERLK